MKGILLVDKPAGMTSHDVVDRLRAVTGIRKIGHTGTLDPSATGLLIMCIGPATRLSEFLTGMDKQYEGDMRLGVTTTSHDMDGEVVAEKPVPELTLDQIQAAANAFVGEIDQVPPMVSAVKVGGQRLYKHARRGEEIEREPRRVVVKRFDILAYESPLVRFVVACSRGTYVRSLCHELGNALGCGAALNRLRRTAVGKHVIGDALPLDEFKSREDVARRLLPLEKALEIPVVVALPSGRARVASGNPLRLSDLQSRCPVDHGLVQITSADGELLALAEVTIAGNEPSLRPKRVFA